MSENEDSKYKEHMIWALVDDVGVTLFAAGEVYPNIIDIPYKMWDAILVHINQQRSEIEAEIAKQRKALSGDTEGGLRKPFLSEIDFRGFPGV